MPRFYCPCPLVIGSTIDLPAETAHHIFVLRLQLGDQLELFNGEGGSFLAILIEVGKKQARAEIKLHRALETELPFGLSLAQALPEGNKMDWIIEKAVELGVSNIQPLAAQRCVVKLNCERAEKKSQHWRSIIQAASEQCGRNRLAHLGELVDVQKWLTQQDLHKRILLSPRGSESLADWARHHSAQAITVMIGPEGGFSDAEEKMAIEHGAICLSMGPRVLRTETAGIVAASILSASWGGI
ncbi:16S rRNA (uracil(1498)-N(3))-methyltransferase [Undibacterium cyanobacteriorum]|uniref:Ribosomal RNA small subunit methyltransferase E n=1 Tax=Undibacterium cyanobacteriorum TaxID=3073561 RepID=A0ABY9RMM0_9BURK|nr:16S rRNA (uracil(1498)-N(3))-methyltransferase [Undibacterium sp. 20NA77.5]WMW82069.1 16S rRNA (uracil(1498)-N(3))-methyltransferase [Undibacterium sp. 20NA77.5]